MNLVVQIVVEQTKHEDLAEKYAKEAEKQIEHNPSYAGAKASLAIYHRLTAEARRSEARWWNNEQ